MRMTVEETLRMRISQIDDAREQLKMLKSLLKLAEVEKKEQMTEQEINNRTEDCVEFIHQTNRQARGEARTLMYLLKEAVEEDVAPTPEIIAIIKERLQRLEIWNAEREKASREIDDLNELAEELYSNRA